MPSLNWIGKEAVEHHHKEVPYRLIHCDGALSAGDPDAGNLLVQGDNLEALKALLPYYGGQVKCIYIDPPYNTGNEGWVYNDNVNSPEIRAWLGKAVGKEAEDLSRHDKWLCMMYPRIRLLRDFLTKDGVIFVSVDDTEVGHLRLLLDEIFGPQNFVVNFIWQKKYTRANDAKYVSDNHDHILAFARDKSSLTISGVARTDKQNAAYKNPDNDPRGPWKATPLHAKSGTDSGRFQHTFRNGISWTPPVGTYHRFSKDTLVELDTTGQLWFGRNGESIPSRKSYLSGMGESVVPVSLISFEEGGSNHDAKTEIRDIFGGVVFDTPKPTRLVGLLMQMVSGPNDIIMDSFAGSGTTGHAVLNANKKDDGNRRFILVEMDNKISGEITAERLRRVISGYDKEGDAMKPVPGLGGGFRYCRLGVPLFNEFGDIDGEVSFPDLAAHVFFAETGAPIPAKAQVGNAYLGKHGAKTVYLLYTQGLEGTPREALGNVLTPDALVALPPPPEDFEGTRVVYAEGATVSADRLKAEGVVFKQIPYQIAGV